MTFHPSLSLPFPPPPITINIMLFRMAIQSQLSGSSQPLTPQLTSPSSTLTALSLFPPAQAPDLNPLPLPKMNAVSQPPIKMILEYTINQWILMRLSCGVPYIKSLRLTGTLLNCPPRAIPSWKYWRSYRHYLLELCQNSHSSMLGWISGRDSAGYWKHPARGQGHCHLEPPLSAQYRRILCPVQIMLPIRSLLANLPHTSPGHKCERCREPDHLEIGLIYKITTICPSTMWLQLIKKRKSKDASGKVAPALDANIHMGQRYMS